MSTENDVPRDWRGTEIKVGAPVIYGGPVGRSIQLVEGVVDGFTKAGRVNVKIMRRAYDHASSYSKRIVHVGADRLVVLNPDSLPPTTLPTWDEAVEQAEVRAAERDRIRATHSGPGWGPVEYRVKTGYGDQENVSWRNGSLPCTACGDTNRVQRECPGKVG